MNQFKVNQFRVNQFKMIFVTVALGSLGILSACSQDPITSSVPDVAPEISAPVVPEPPATPNPGVTPPSVTAPNPPTAPPVPLVPTCIDQCLYTVQAIAPLENTLQLTKLNGAGEILGIRNNKPVIYRNGTLEDLPKPEDINGSQTETGETDTYSITSNGFGDYMIAKRIVKTGNGAVEYHTWFHRNGSPETAFIYKSNFHGVAMSDTGRNLSDDPARFQSNTPDLQNNSLIPHLIWNVNRNTDTTISDPGFLWSINNAGIAVGRGNNSDGKQPVSLRNGNKTLLGSLDQSGTSLGTANDINADGVIVGYSSVIGKLRAFRHFNGPSGRKMYPMGDAGCETTNAIAINDAGVSVLNGTGCTNSPNASALINTSDSTQNLNSQIDSNEGWELSSVVDINNKGQILAVGKQNGVRKFVLINPIN